MTKVRIGYRVRVFLEGSQAATDKKEPNYELFQRVLNLKADGKGAVRVELSEEDKDVLRDYVEVFVIGAQDNLGGWGEDGRDALADVNAGRACLRALEPKPEIS